MERAGRAGGKSVTGASSPSSYQASSAWPARTTALHQASRHIERRTPWSYLDRSQTSPVQHQAPVFTGFGVLPGAVRADELVPGAQGGHGLGEGGAAAVGEGVVGDDALDRGDAAAGEVGRCAAQERRAGGAGLVR